MPTTLARSLYPMADAAFGLYGRWRALSYDPAATIVVASTGRGGSTWIAGLVATLPGRILLWEPLHLGNNPECTDYGFTWQNYVPPESESAAKRDYLGRLFRGLELSTRTLTSLHLRPAHLIAHQGYVVKFVNANMMLPWALRQFSLRAVLLVRHPCAVVASQMGHEAWKGLTKEQCTIPPGLFEDYPHFRDIYNWISEPEEVLAFEWAAQTHVPLSQPTPHPWFVTTYETLVIWGRQEVDRLFDYLGEPVPPQTYTQLHVASPTTAQGSNVAKGKDPLMGWCERLSAQQIDNVLRVTTAMGVDFYTDALMPDFARIPGYEGPAPHTASS